MSTHAGVERVEGVTGANAWLVATAAGRVLVDTGLPGNARRVLAHLGARGLGLGDLAAIVLTHADPDHAGSAGTLARLAGAPVAIHELDAPALAGRLTPRAALGRPAPGTRLRRLARAGHELSLALLLRGPGRLFGWGPVRADRLLRDGDEVAGLTVVHAPGHTAGSIALRRDDGALFTGDAVFGDGLGRAHPPPAAASLDPALARETARRLVASGFSVLYPGHGRPVVGRRAT